MSRRLSDLCQSDRVRIIAGKYRRRKLLPPAGTLTRPITDRAKEILFERLGEQLVGARVADVFAGTGSLGLEALSRGARSVVFIENDRSAFGRLKQNVEKLGAHDCTLCWRTDALRTSFRPKGVEHLVPFDLVFFDPPYRLIEKLRPREPIYAALERLARPAVSAGEALLLLRTPRNAQLQLPGCWRVSEEQEIGTMSIQFLRQVPAT